MTPHKQLIEHDPEADRWGDCHRTCIAAILDMHPSDVPHFCDGSPTREDKRPWLQQQTEWLADRGLAAASMCYDGSSLELDTLMHWTSRANPEVPMILGGKSSLGCNHSVVVLNGEIVCDPSGNGIVGPMCENLWWITIISMVEPAKLFARRGLA